MCNVFYGTQFKIVSLDNVNTLGDLQIQLIKKLNLSVSKVLFIAHSSGIIGSNILSFYRSINDVLHDTVFNICLNEFGTQNPYQGTIPRFVDYMTNLLRYPSPTPNANAIIDLVQEYIHVLNQSITRDNIIHRFLPPPMQQPAAQQPATQPATTTQRPATTTQSSTQQTSNSSVRIGYVQGRAQSQGQRQGPEEHDENEENEHEEDDHTDHEHREQERGEQEHREQEHREQERGGEERSGQTPRPSPTVLLATQSLENALNSLMETISRRTGRRSRNNGNGNGINTNPHGTITENFTYNLQDGLVPQTHVVIMQQFEDVVVTISEDDFENLISDIDYDDIDPDNKCIICQQSFIEQENIVNLNSCNHIFHYDCIKTLLTRFNTHCPTCRSDVRDYLNTDMDSAIA